MLDKRARDIAPLIARLGPVAPSISADAVILEVHKRALVVWDSRIDAVTQAAFPAAPTHRVGSAAWMAAQAAYEVEFKRVMAAGLPFDAYGAAALEAIHAAFSPAPPRDTLMCARFTRAREVLKARFPPRTPPSAQPRAPRCSRSRRTARRPPSCQA